MHELPHAFVHFRTDQHVACGCCRGIPRRFVHGIANHRKFRAGIRTHKSMHHFSAMDSDAKIAARFIAKCAFLIYFRGAALNLHCRAERIFILARIVIRDAEDGQNGVTCKSVDNSAVREDNRNHHSQVIVEHFDDIIWFHVLRQLRKLPEIGLQDCDFIALPA